MNLTGISRVIIRQKQASILRCRRFSGVADEYAALLRRQILKPDKAQAIAVDRLEKLSRKMLIFEKQRDDYNSQLRKYVLDKQKLESCDEANVWNDTQKQQQSEKRTKKSERRARQFPQTRRGRGF